MCAAAVTTVAVPSELGAALHTGPQQRTVLRDRHHPVEAPGPDPAQGQDGHHARQVLRVSPDGELFIRVIRPSSCV